MKTYGVILAAGDSTRFDAEVNKLFYKVNGKELVLYPVETFLENNEIDDVLLVSRDYELYLMGLELDYSYDDFESMFKFNNPKATSSCGCGTSFAI